MATLSHHLFGFLKSEQDSVVLIKYTWLNPIDSRKKFPVCQSKLLELTRLTFGEMGRNTVDPFCFIPNKI